MKVTIAGVGPGNSGLLTAQAAGAISRSRVLIGAPRLLDSFPDHPGEKFAAAAPREIAERISTLSQGPVAVLVSGDPGFFSAAKRLGGLLAGYEVEILCGVSSLSYFAARIGIPWEDVKLVSLHGREGNPGPWVRANRRTFFLTGGKWRVQDICRRLCDAGLGELPAFAGEELSYSGERIASGTVHALAQGSFRDLAVLLVENPRPLTPSGVPGLPDSCFIRGKAPMTKSEVRSVILSKLRPQNGETLYDVGAGTGSVAVELALQNPAGSVYAVERSPDCCELIAKNRDQFALGNLEIIAGKAPEALGPLPAPDAAFVGGSSGNLREIIEALIQKNPAVRIVVSAVTLETAAQATACLRDYDLRDAEIVQVAVSRADPVGSCHMMRAQNPVTIFSTRGKG